MITTNYSINYASQIVPEVIPAVQGDTGRTLIFTPADFTIPAGCTATYYVQKPSGEAVYNTAAISDGKITCALTAQALAEVGENKLQVRVLNGEDIVTSFSALLIVHPFEGEGAIESSTEINIFDQAVEAAKEEITAAVGEAEGEIETATEEAIAQVHESALAFYVTDTASGAIASFPDGADLVPVKGLTVDVEPVQSGSGDPSPSNVRPITGWTEAVVTRTGKNLLDADTAYASYKQSDGSFRLAGINADRIKNTVPSALVGVPLTFSVYADLTKETSPTAVIVEANVGGTTINGTRIEGNTKGTGSVTFTPSSTSDTFWLTYGSSGGNYFTMKDLQLEVGDTATEYEPFKTIETYTIDLDGTRYGGTLDVTTGVLTVDRQYWTDDGTKNWVMNNNGSFCVALGTATPTQDTTERCGCNYAPYTISFNGLAVFARPNGLMSLGSGWGDIYASTDALKSAFAQTPLQVVYPLAEPFTVQLTAEEVTTLLGQNAVFADCGNVTVAYRADTKLYIDKLLNT